MPTSRIHRVAMFMMSLCAMVAIAAGIGFATVGWTGSYRRVVIAIFAFAIVGLIASVAIAVLGAARDTYARRSGPSARAP